MIHEQFDLAYWVEKFPLSDLWSQARSFVLARREQNPAQYPTERKFEDHVDIMQPGGDLITGPREVVITEQLRKEAFSTSDFAPPSQLPTDLFVWAKGVPVQREITKIGGLPYWPRSKSWPLTRFGTPMEFVAQISFIDSTDIVGKMPGDILLVFIDYKDFYDTFDPADLHLEWIQLGQTDLISENDLPTLDHNYTPYYAQLHRTLDYPDAELAFVSYNQPDKISVFEGTKIGGVPRWVQSDSSLQGRFICSIGSLSPSMDKYPFLNVPEPLDLNSYLDDDDANLMWGDVGSLYVYPRLRR